MGHKLTLFKYNYCKLFSGRILSDNHINRLSSIGRQVKFWIADWCRSLILFDWLYVVSKLERGQVVEWVIRIMSQWRWLG